MSLTIVLKLFALFQMSNRQDYIEIMSFINLRKRQDTESAFDNIRRQKFQHNLMLMIALHGLGYLIVLAFFTFPLLEFILGQSIRFSQPLYVPFDFAAYSWIWYGMMYIFVCFSTHNSGVLVITTCLFLNSLIEYLSNEFNILGISFENAMNNADDVERFKDLIRHHQELLRFNLSNWLNLMENNFLK